jgi:hypothetical protein
MFEDKTDKTEAGAKTERCDIVLFKGLEPLEPTYNFDVFLYAKRLRARDLAKKSKFEKIDADVVLVDMEGVGLEQGKEFLAWIFPFKKEKNFLLGLEGVKSYEMNKAWLEMKRNGISIVDIFFPYLYAQDAMDYYQSGLNHVLLDIMKRNFIGLGIPLQALKDVSKIGKTIQNIEWSKKKAVNLCVCSLAKNAETIFDAIDVFHFLIALGATPRQAKNALAFACVKRQLNQEIFKHKVDNAFVYKESEEIKLIDLMNKLKMN